MFNFGPASKDETIVYGSERPAYDNPENEALIIDWLNYMRENGIQRVCCLLEEKTLSKYPINLLERYEAVFGKENVCHAPVADFHLVDPDLLKGKILPFLKKADEDQVKVLVHCSAGMGRTGHILAAWLVHGRNLPVQQALEEVVQVPGTYRSPTEAVDHGSVKNDDLSALLESCRV